MNAEEAKKLAQESALRVLRRNVSEAATNGQTQACGYFGLTRAAAEYATDMLNKEGYRCTVQSAEGNAYVSIFWD